MAIRRLTAPSALEPAQAEVARQVLWQAGKVSAAERARLLNQQPVTVWLTGLSGSGKSTIAFELERRLISAGRACFVLDGDNVRLGLSHDLGFSPSDRRENIRRVAEVGKLMNDAGLIVVTAFISPYARDRGVARSIIGEERFVETYLRADLAACERRDAKGLYAEARAGKIPDFTGISAPYEAPTSPDVTLDTVQRNVDECVTRLLEAITSRIG